MAVDVPQHIEGCRSCLAHVGSHGQRLGIDNQLRSGSSALQGYLLVVRSCLGAVGVVSLNIEVVGLTG